jgi:hypothetical protein
MDPSLDHPDPLSKARKSGHAPALVYRYLNASTVVLRAERRAAPSRPAWAMCSRLDAASIAVPSGAEAGHIAPSGRDVPAEELRHRRGAVCKTDQTRRVQRARLCEG